jgi:large conductance mechanosensitive channel
LVKRIITIASKASNKIAQSEALNLMNSDQEILEELRKIREAVTPKPVPPEAKPKGLIAEFMDFIGKAGVIGLAVGFIMGTYIGKVVSALVQDIIMPIPGALIPGGDWRKANATLPVGAGINFAIGDFAGVIVDFLIVAVVVFFIAKYAGRAIEKAKP